MPSWAKESVWPVAPLCTGVVLGIGEVAHPEVQLQRAEIALGVGARVA